MIKRKYTGLLAMGLCTLLLFSGCSSETNSLHTKEMDGAGKTKATTLAEQQFFSGFKEVKSNPIDPDIVRALWFASISEGEEKPASTNTESALIEEMAQKYLQLVNNEGVHFVETTTAMGMSLDAERWMKNGKFKKVELDSDKVTLFDGAYWYEYSPQKKTGLRYKKEDAAVAAKIPVETEGPLFAYRAASGMPAPVYQLKGEKELNGHKCLTFFIEMALMGMKGNTLWVDKDTGVLVKNMYGENDEMSMTVTKFEKGGFKDDVFTVPADVIITDQ